MKQKYTNLTEIDVNSSSFGDVGASKKWARFSFRVSQDKLLTRNFDKNNSLCDFVTGSIRIYFMSVPNCWCKTFFFLCYVNTTVNLST
jgi:hypothetical protein